MSIWVGNRIFRVAIEAVVDMSSVSAFFAEDILAVGGPEEVVAVLTRFKLDHVRLAEYQA